jgi:hypothetical protein
MALNGSDFMISVKFDDEDEVQLGGGGEFFLTPGEGRTSFMLDDDRLSLIRALQAVEEDLTK